jgi:hypothetical protein
MEMTCDHRHLPIEGEELRFEQVGKFRAGAHEIEIPLGTKFVAIVPSLRVGWVKWREGFEEEIASEMHWGLIGDYYKLPSRAQLGETDPACWKYPDQDPWQEVDTMALMECKSGKAFTFVAATGDELKAIRRLAVIYGDMVCIDKTLLPIVALRTRSEQRGMLQLHRPFFEVVNWTRPPDGRSRRKSPTPNAPSLLNIE